MSADYEAQAARAKTVITALETELAKKENDADIENPFLAAFRKHENTGKLTREVMIELVEYIKAYEGGGIAVRFRYKDEMRHACEYIEVNTQRKAG